MGPSAWVTRAPARKIVPRTEIPKKRKKNRTDVVLRRDKD